MKTFNLNSDEWDVTRDREGWCRKGVGVAERIGGELIGATMSEVEPGSRLWPYHTHYLNEEWVIVLRGEPTLRTPEGEHVLKEGDVVCFPRGKAAGMRECTGMMLLKSHTQHGRHQAGDGPRQTDPTSLTVT